MMTKIHAVGLAAALAASCLTVSGTAANAGTCGSPAAAYFYYGAPAPVIANGRVAVPAKADPGADVCRVGGPGEGFVVPPGVHFVVGELHVPVTEEFTFYCVSGRGLGFCAQNAKKISSGTDGVSWAQTPVLTLDPTAVNGFTISFSAGAQQYRSIS